ncbi:alpha/beta fold hydrolase [Flexivirga caeni]|uniref:Alpha/beta fold hydrolase n=1 Tax=Flexivirga caeni TaxID=2294115 RepID=A0A3M9M1N7_9MICO|nr:alpha/beta fold hydrolase [Flexivirga caeni]RNI19476.1 alpha/beta fold hydrolase [Flexivirga caeni]
MVSLPGRSTIERITREVERNTLRARNGIRMATGIQHTQVGLSPKDVVWRGGRTQLWHYRSDRVTMRPPLLIVYSLFNKSYILDLRPGNSVVEHLIAAGFDVYLIDWGIPDERDAQNTIEDYTDFYLPAVIDQVCAISGSDSINLFGYCFGGLLAVLHAAHHPTSPLRSLTALTTPADLSALGPMGDALGRSDIDAAIGSDGLVPPSVIMQGFRSLDPMAEVTSRVDLVERLWNDEFVTAYQAMTGWGSDQVPLPGALARQLQQMVVDNALVNDRITIGGDRVRLRDIRLPFAHVLGLRDHIIPLDSAAPLVGLVGSAEKREYRFDAGHVGLMVGRTAAKNTVPAIIDVVKQQSEAT